MVCEKGVCCLQTTETLNCEKADRGGLKAAASVVDGGSKHR